MSGSVAAPERERTRPRGGGVSFGGILSSEWVKLRSLRSTWWVASSLVVLGVAISALLAFSLGGDVLDDPRNHDGTSTVALPVGIALAFLQLIVVVLGVISITSEFGTGMIRSSFAAVPGRISLLGGKAIIVGSASFVLGAVTAVLSWAASYAILVARGASIAFPDLSVPLWSILGTAGCLALTAVFGLAVGAIVRSTAVAISICVGVLLVLTIVVQIVIGVTQAEWLAHAQDYLLSNAATGVVIPRAEGAMAPWQSLLIVVGWAVVPLVAGLVLVRRRDV
ncbi:ABC transporter permease subunit [Leifsonia shinshuensis]|uniref:ABC transporter permease subunit n=1 Tax=Leifsonia shinshuensis TaxID=150026 RepID=UPI002866B8DA|nr:ABC transporter permease subunit [Leifsonia shinshuensis]MDR6971880.1 ABC-2 type transport system permease protein [Leifsonia shinshuensis]